MVAYLKDFGNEYVEDRAGFIKDTVSYFMGTPGITPYISDKDVYYSRNLEFDKLRLYCADLAQRELLAYEDDDRVTGGHFARLENLISLQKEKIKNGVSYAPLGSFTPSFTPSTSITSNTTGAVNINSLKTQNDITENGKNNVIIYPTYPTKDIVTFCLTGTLSATRNVITQKIKEVGWKVHTNPVFTVDYLVVGLQPGEGKVSTAKSRDIPLISEEILNEWLDRKKKEQKQNIVSNKPLLLPVKPTKKIEKVNKLTVKEVPTIKDTTYNVPIIERYIPGARRFRE